RGEGDGIVHAGPPRVLDGRRPDGQAQVAVSVVREGGGRVVEHDVGEAAVGEEGGDVAGEVEVAGLRHLGGEVGDEHTPGGGGGQGVADARHEQGRDHAGEQRAGPDQDGVG